MKAEFHKPIFPWRINQAWGIKNPIYEQFGFSRHNGTDVALGENAEVRSPCDATITRASEQSGGGIFISLLSDNNYEFPDGEICRVLFDFLHLSRYIVKEGQRVKVGDLLAYADNTGFSTGPHTHIQMRRIRIRNGQQFVIDQNDANNSIDPELYWSQIYAKDFGTLRAQLAVIALKIAELLQRMKGR